MSSLVDILEHSSLVVAGGVLCYYLLRRNSRLAVAQARASQSATPLTPSPNEAQVAANEEAFKRGERTELLELERRLGEREGLINSQLARLVEEEKLLKEQKEALRQREDALKGLQDQAAEKNRQAAEELQKVAALSEAQAREIVLKQVEQQSLREANNLARRIVEEAKTRAEEKARHVISVAIQRYAGDHTFANTTASIALHGDEIKGRIIGREGRNIRAFEAATGVTVMIDDTPGAVLLSGFDPVRREIAREAMLQLVADGRIHPTRIEEVVAKVTQEMDETIIRLGEEAVVKAGLPAFPLEIVKLLGRLHFRHSYSQNVLDHSVEVAHLMGMMAAELGLDITLAKRAGLLHDIGKAVNHEIEGPHAVVGAELIRRHGECEAVVNGVASHHNDVPPNGPLGILVSAADAISASRPGARSENMTTYLKRVEDLERIATAFPGVEKAFAVQAGRELRVFVQPDEVGDEAAFALARNVVSKIENELQYPGQIKVTVIREKRCVEVAQ
jgi:ribonuclease Y